MKNMEGVEREAGASGGEEGGAVGGDAEGERTKSMGECKWRKVAIVLYLWNKPIRAEVLQHVRGSNVENQISLVCAFGPAVYYQAQQ